MTIDFHIHTCLSPCASLEMSPRAIVSRALDIGLDAIVVADHNSARNTPAVIEVAGGTGLTVLPGLEIATREDVHLLTVFDNVKDAMAMDAIIQKSLLTVNKPGRSFDDQPVVNAAEEVLELVPVFLGQSTCLSIAEVLEQTHRLGGLCIAAHVDRDSFSMTSQLGFLAGDEGFDAVEATRFVSASDLEHYRTLYPVVMGSDAHYINDIGCCQTHIDLDTVSVSSVLSALKSRTGVRVSGEHYE